MHLKVRIKQLMRQLGFELVGFARPDPPPHHAAYRRWIAAGRQAGMAYLSTERAVSRRSDPRRILPEVKTILVVGLRYANPAHPATESPAAPTGKVAAYAWGNDYHDVIVPRLAQAARQIEAWTQQPVAALAYSDTGAILERDYAALAGLGWIGKNTCLISPQHGSYFLLGELLLSIEIDPDEPFHSDHCGTCRRCIEACPTGCILPDRTLDAARCISYLTIENKQAIPIELRAQMDDWVFGCDVCQQVCPWNLRFAAPEGDPALAPRPHVPRPILTEEIALSPNAFKDKFKDSPLLRPRRRGYLRNVAVALGNAGDPHAIDALSACLRSEPEALVRAHAAWALGRIGGQRAAQTLRDAQQSEQDASVLAEIQQALARCADAPLTPGNSGSAG